MAQIVLILGGARSGKSAYARRLASAGPEPIMFLATLEAGDEEMRRRIERHRSDRPDNWLTLEEPADPVEALRRISPAPATVILDCLSGWVANVLLGTAGEEPSPDDADRAEQDVLQRVDRLLDWQREAAARLIIVSNETGLGIVPAYPLSRVYRDVLGLAHQRSAAAADEVYFLVAGIPQTLKGTDQ